jgi:hypothetical protein
MKLFGDKQQHNYWHWHGKDLPCMRFKAFTTMSITIRYFWTVVEHQCHAPTQKNLILRCASF